MRAGHSRRRGATGPWLTDEQNLLFAMRHAAGGAPRTDIDSIVDGHTGCRMIEIRAAILPSNGDDAVAISQRCRLRS